MKKTLLIMPILILIILTSCVHSEYSGNYSNLYTVAINSVLWLNGHSWGADFECDPQIEIIDEDRYGRIMFTYYEKYYSGGDLSFSALIICQDSNEKEVFYYENVNYIIKKQVIFSQLEEFNREEIEYLKSINDWNQEINYDKCIKKEITKNKSNIPNEKEIKKEIIDEFDLINGQYALFMDFLTNNSDNSKFIVYGYIIKSEKEGIYFVGLVEKEKDYFLKINIIVPLNVYDYTTEFIEFKESNNW